MSQSYSVDCRIVDVWWVSVGKTCAGRLIRQQVEVVGLANHRVPDDHPKGYPWEP